MIVLFTEAFQLAPFGRYFALRICFWSYLVQYVAANQPVQKFIQKKSNNVIRECSTAMYYKVQLLVVIEILI